MIIVRNVFIAMPGKASKLAEQIKQAASVGDLPRHRVLTDVTGDFNRVVLEYEVDSLGAVEEQLENYATNEKLRAAMKGYTDLYRSGYREILKVV